MSSSTKVLLYLESTIRLKKLLQVSLASSSTSDDEKEVPQLVRRRRRVVDPVLVLSLNLEDSKDLSSDQLQPMSEDQIEHSYTENTTANPSSREVEMVPQFKAVSEKKSISCLVPLRAPFVQTLLPVQD